MSAPMKQPNNLRNRYRRYREAHRAYRFCPLRFRDWASTAAPDSYSAKPGQPDEIVALTRAGASVREGALTVTRRAAS